MGVKRGSRKYKETANQEKKQQNQQSTNNDDERTATEKENPAPGTLITYIRDIKKRETCVSVDKNRNKRHGMQ